MADAKDGTESQSSAVCFVMMPRSLQSIVACDIERNV